VGINQSITSFETPGTPGPIPPPIHDYEPWEDDVDDSHFDPGRLVSHGSSGEKNRLSDDKAAKTKNDGDR